MDSGGLPVVPVLFCGLASAICIPWFRSARGLRWGGAVAMLLGMGSIALRNWGRLRFEFDVATPFSNYLAFVQNNDDGQAGWVAWGGDPWTSQFTGRDLQSRSLPQFYAYDNFQKFAVAHRRPDLVAPRIIMETDQTDAGVRSVRLRLHAPAGARILEVWEELGHAPLETRIAGKAIYDIVRFIPRRTKRFGNLFHRFGPRCAGRCAPLRLRKRGLP